jgi:alanine racemase
MMNRTKIEISKSALLYNYDSIKRVVGDTSEIVAVVKANAYGHGAVEVCRILACAGVRWFAVWWTAEAVRLRRAGVRENILVFGTGLDHDYEGALHHALTPVFHSVRQVQQFEQVCRRNGLRRNFHLEIDAGLNRLGIKGGRDVLAATLRTLDYSTAEGILTHLDHDSAHRGPVSAAVNEFDDLLAWLAAEGLRVRYAHAFSSEALVSGLRQFDLRRYNMIRVGRCLYGTALRPDELGSVPGVCQRPCLSWRTAILSINTISAGESLGYCRSFIATRRTRIGILGIGYADGLPFSTSDQAEVLIHGTSARLVGEVSMNLAMVDITDLPHADIGSTVTLIGRDGDRVKTAFDLADAASILCSELLSRLPAEVPRYVVG